MRLFTDLSGQGLPLLGDYTGRPYAGLLNRRAGLPITAFNWAAKS